MTIIRGTQGEYSSKPLKHSFVKRVLVFKVAEHSFAGGQQ